VCARRSDPTLQRKDKALGLEAADNRHAATSSEPHTQAPAAGFPQYRMIDVPPSDYLAKPLADDKVMDHPPCSFVSAAATNGCLGDAAVRRQTSDRKVAGLTPVDSSSAGLVAL